MNAIPPTPPWWRWFLRVLAGVVTAGILWVAGFTFNVYTAMSTGLADMGVVITQIQNSVKLMERDLQSTDSMMELRLVQAEAKLADGNRYSAEDADRDWSKEIIVNRGLAERIVFLESLTTQNNKAIFDVSRDVSKIQGQIENENRTK